MFNKKSNVSAMSRAYAGFTLAEVLITLLVIGVVAALTIPTLMANTQKAQYVTALKKAYTTWNQVLVQMSTDKGSPGDLSKSDLFAAGTTGATFGEEAVKYFNVVKICRAGESGCVTINSSTYTGLPKATWGEDTTAFRFITADGMSYTIDRTAAANPDCSNDNSWFADPNIITAVSQSCGWLEVDVNGLKGPNNWGRDIFRFYITNGRGPSLYPDGGTESTMQWKEDDGSVEGNVVGCFSGNIDGRTCAGRVIEESWEMNY